MSTLTHYHHYNYYTNNNTVVIQCYRLVCFASCADLNVSSCSTITAKKNNSNDISI